MPKLPHIASAAVGASVLVAACAKVPYTERRQYNLVPDSIMSGLGKTSYADTLSSVKVQKKGSDVTTLERVGSRISKVAKQPKFAWEFSLIEDETINAWCLPGGYIGFYTGILPVLQNESGMAFVMGHEVGHAVAHHGAERMSQQLTLIGGLAGLELFLANKTKLEPEQRAVVLGAIGLGAEVGAILPFSRMHESEADVLGMMYMAEAGYPPAESIEVWERMSALAGKSSVPVFLSTHPSNEKRIANQKEWLPEARKKYKRNERPDADALTATLWK